MQNDDLPCSRAQEAIWFAEQASDIGAASNLPLAIELTGGLDVDNLRRALAAVMRAQPALRTRFTARSGRLVRAELQPAAVADVDLAVDDTREVAAAIAERSRVPLDLLREPFTMALFRTQQPERHVLFGNFHHAIFDGTSKDIFARELAEAYGALAVGRRPPAAERGAYARYVALERQPPQVLCEEARRYWEPTLQTIRDALPFPRSAHAGEEGAAGEALRFALDAPLKERLEAIAQQHGVSMFVLLMAAVQVLQHAYAGRAPGGVATLIPLGTRPPEMRDMIGMFVNEVPLYTEPEPEATLLEYASDVRRRARALFRLRLFPFNEAVARFGPAEDPHSLLPNFSVSYWRSSGSELDAAGVRMTVDRLLPIYGRRWGARFRFLHEPGRFVAGFEYDSSVLHEAAARRVVDHLRTLLEAIVADPGRPLRELSPLPAAERRALLFGWNATQTDSPSETLQELTEAQVARTPDRTALVFEGTELTYAELNERANRLARRLIELGARPDVRVGLLLDRGLDLAVAMLAIAKAGAGHVPLDPEYPRERLEFMLRDTRAPILVTQRALLSRVPPGVPDVLCMDDVGRDWGYGANPPVRARPDSLAYVIYTSGSTGRPKGAELVQRAVTNLIRTMIEAPGLAPDDVFLSVTTPAFDIGTIELLAPLAVGARVVIAPTDVATDGHRLAKLLDASGATVMFATPSRWRLLVRAGWRGRQKVMVGGEALPADLAEALVRRSPEVWNIYGPTETTVFSTRQRVVDPERLSIGRPVANTRLYVVDHTGAALPTGVPGELWIGGIGLARGYLNRPELTAERFSDDPFEPAGGRVYKTGDLVRYRDDGEVEFIGRIDQQVKTRGFRVEPGEIEAALCDLTGVEQAAVVAREDAPGQKRLIAYVVTPGAPASTHDLRARLAARLPDFMVPSAFVALEQLPLNANGKVDRARLPAPAARSELDTPHVAPRTSAEETLASIWEAVLGVDKVGVHDNFFELGGHSLLAAEVVARTREAFDADLSMRVLFSAPTVAQMVAVLGSGGHATSGERAIPRVPRRPLSEWQQARASGADSGRT